MPKEAGSVQDQVGWGSQQPLVGGVLAHDRVV